MIVWIHGGGNVSGATNDYDGSKLATGGPSGTPTVVVTINYRMGLYGFLSHPALNAEGHPWGNYGILDTQAALRWVQRNIEAFGGDPDNVTLGGQSAGAIDTSCEPDIAGGRGAVPQGDHAKQPHPQCLLRIGRDGIDRGNAFAAAAGCPGSVHRPRPACAS